MDQADSQRGSPPILFDQPSHGSQDDSSHLPWSNKISSQINTDILGQSDFVNDEVGSYASIDNALQTNGLFTPPQSNCIAHFSNNLQLQQSLNELTTLSPLRQPSYLEDSLRHTLSEPSANAAAFSQGSYTVNNQHSSTADHGNAFLGFVDVVQQTSGLAPARPRPSHLEDFLNYTLSGQSAHTAASQCSYPASDPQTTLTALDNTVQLSPAYSNHLGNFPNHKLLEQSVGVAVYSPCSYPASDPQTTLTGFDSTVRPLSAYSILEQSASIAANSQCSYPANDLQTTLTDPDNTFQPPPSFDLTRPGNLPSHTLFAEFNDATAYSQVLYPANNPQATLADLGNVHQISSRSHSSCHEAWENNILVEYVGQSSIIIPLSLALTEHQDLAQNFKQYPHPWLLQPNIEHQLGSPSAGLALVNQSLAPNRRQNPCIGCRLRKIKCQKISSNGEPRCVRYYKVFEKCTFTLTLLP
ncbi:hypothetical protein EG329_005007 [Mollisiaceae sp. DMI_Dod_QoI]|nr:hypothetical protein EG329_005007 [Helotiales sp. DMI_Dod_QoI]